MNTKVRINLRRIALFLAITPPFAGLLPGMVNAILMVVALIIICVTEDRITFPRNLLIWSIAFASFALLSYVWAEDRTTVLKTTLSFIQVVILALDIVLACKHDSDLRFVIQCMVFGAFVYIIRRVITTPLSQLLSMGRIGGGNPLTIRFCTLAVLIFIRRKQYRMKALMWITILLLCFFAFLQGSRKGIFIVVIGFAITIFWEAKFKHKAGAFLRAAGGILIVGIGVYLAIMKIPALYQSIGVRIEETLTFFEKGEAIDRSTETRDMLIREAFRIWKEHPILGIGQDAFRYVNHVRKDFYSHNNYLEILANLGLVGLLLYYSIFVAAFVKVTKILWEKENAYLIPAFAILLLKLITDYMQVSYSGEAGYAFAGFAFAQIRLYENGEYEARRENHGEII